MMYIEKENDSETYSGTVEMEIRICTCHIIFFLYGRKSTKNLVVICFDTHK